MLVMGHRSYYGTAMDAKALFLARMQSDSGLQRLLQDPAIISAAVAIARAAGFIVTPAELTASNIPGQPSPSDPSANTGGVEGELIDFDGDGIPDAVRRGDRWELTAQYED